MIVKIVSEIKSVIAKFLVEKDVGGKRCHTNCSVFRTPTILSNIRISCLSIINTILHILKWQLLFVACLRRTFPYVAVHTRHSQNALLILM